MISFMVILFDQYNMSDDIYEIVFATKQQIIVAKLLLNIIKQKNGEITKTEMSYFATRLHEGEMEDTISPPVGSKPVKISYNKRQFYDRILTPMKSMGMIDYDLYKKTYKISERFNKAMIKIGIMWLNEIRRSA